MSKPVLGYWDIRGLAQPTRLLLQYLGVDYEDKRYGFGSGPEPSPDAWFSEKFTHGLEFPNVPYWIDENIKLTESRAIIKYIARTRGSAVVPDNAEDQAVADMLEGVMGDLQRALLNVAYAKTGKPESPLEQELSKKFEYLQDFFNNKNWILGDKITYADFYLYEVLFEFWRYNKEFLKPYPALEAFKARFENLPQLSEYIKTQDHLMCYSPYAIIQF